VWLRHWNLERDPFLPFPDAYVSTPPHDEAVARVVHAIRSGERVATLQAEAGLGKSIVLGRVLREVRAGGLRVARAVAPIDGASLYDQLSRSLGIRVKGERTRAAGWQTLVEAARLIAAQRGRLVMVVDDVHLLLDRTDFDRLTHLDPRSCPTLIGSGRSDAEEADPDAFLIPLVPLTRSEANAYLATKLRNAGRPDLTFDPGALTLIHAMSEGVPRRLDRLAGLAMREAGGRRLAIVSAELVESIDREAGLLLPRFAYDPRRLIPRV
jgi:type II secretory pathway predicted ATPase ExeA